MLRFRSTHFFHPSRRRPGIASSSVSSSPAPVAQATGPPIIRIPPPLLAAGGLDPGQDGPAAALKFTSHVAANYIEIDASPFAGKLRVLNVDPPIMTISDFLKPEQCDALCAAAHGSGRMAVSSVGGHNIERQKEIRTSRTLAATSEVLKEHPALEAALEELLVRARELLPGAPPKGGLQFSKPTTPNQVSFELPQIAHYTQGQHFLSHEDAFPPDIARQKGYQRRATLLVYLNDVDRGGQTKFDHLGFGVQPKKGQALLFFPSYNWSAPDKRTLHTAVDAEDDKWIFQLWVCSALPQRLLTKGELPPGIKKATRGNGGTRKR